MSRRAFEGGRRAALKRPDDEWAQTILNSMDNDDDGRQVRWDDRRQNDLQQAAIRQARTGREETPELPAGMSEPSSPAEVMQPSFVGALMSPPFPKTQLLSPPSQAGQQRAPSPPRSRLSSGDAGFIEFSSFASPAAKRVRFLE